MNEDLHIWLIAGVALIAIPLVVWLVWEEWEHDFRHRSSAERWAFLALMGLLILISLVLVEAALRQ